MPRTIEAMLFFCCPDSNGNHSVRTAARAVLSRWNDAATREKIRLFGHDLRHVLHASFARGEEKDLCMTVLWRTNQVERCTSGKMKREARSILSRLSDAEIVGQDISVD